MPVSTSTRAFVGRLTELSVFDPLGDQVGRVRDVVVTFSLTRARPRVIGLVVEVPGRRRVFVPMTRVTNIDAGQVITTGLLNMRRFEKRSTETLVVGQMLDRKVRVRSTGVEGVVYDVAMEQARPPNAMSATTPSCTRTCTSISSPHSGFRFRPSPLCSAITRR